VSRVVRVDLSTQSGCVSGHAIAMQRKLRGKSSWVRFEDEKRTLDQNSMFYALYQQIAAQAGDQSVNDVRRECKLRHGVPILRAGNEQFKAMYDKAMLHSLNYEEKLQAMDILPVTRLMTKEQGTTYIETILREYSAQGYSLIHPS